MKQALARALGILAASFGLWWLLSSVAPAQVMNPLTFWRIQQARINSKAVEVCASGCRYSTIGSALASIADAASSKRYTVLIYPGDYDETLTAKSYVTLMGAGDRSTVRIRGDGTTTATYLYDADVTEGNLSNLTVGGSGPIQVKNNITNRRILRITNCIIGIIDGTENTTKSIDGIVTFSSNSKTDFLVSDTDWNGTWDMIRIGNDDVYRCSGCRYFNQGTATAATITAWSVISNGQGAQFYESGCQVSFNLTANADGNPVKILNWASASGTPHQANVFSLAGCTVDVNIPSATNTAGATGFMLASAASDTTPSTVNLRDARLAITSASASGAIVGTQSQAASTFSNWTDEWNGGEIALSGGASRTDAVQNTTVAGFVMSIRDVRHAGVYTGAGAITVNSPLIDGRNREATLAAAPGTCLIGDTYVNTSGVTFGCVAANTWADVTTKQKTITVANPTASENDSMGFFTNAATITRIHATIQGSTSATMKVRYGTDRSGAGATDACAATAISSMTTGTDVTITNSAIPAVGYLWLVTSALSGTPTELTVTVDTR